MNERVIEIVVYIVYSLRSGSDENIIGEIKNLSERLVDQGYSENEINSAFTWLMNEMSTSEEDGELDLDQLLSQQAIQNWSNYPKPNIKPAPYDFLVQLRELDIIGENEIEQILDQSLRHGKNSTSISEIKAMVARLIMNPENVSDGSFFVFNQDYRGH